jgi:DNA-binding response OmpR family regulator
VMPGMDGFQALELIREKSDIPVIMVSGLGNMSPLRTSFILGADDYIKKPFHSRELLARIEAKLRRRKS